MIFVTLGSQKFQFNRLLQKLDKLIESGDIREEVFAQIGYSTYRPVHFTYKEFLDCEEFGELFHKSEVIITHGGTGSIMKAIKLGKKVIAVPRLAKYGEHVDDHQVEIVNKLLELNMICGLPDMAKFEDVLMQLSNMKLEKHVSNTERLIDSIQNYIEEVPVRNRLQNTNRMTVSNGVTENTGEADISGEAEGDILSESNIVKAVNPLFRGKL